MWIILPAGLISDMIMLSDKRHACTYIIHQPWSCVIGLIISLHDFWIVLYLAQCCLSSNNITAYFQIRAIDRSVELAVVFLICESLCQLHLSFIDLYKQVHDYAFNNECITSEYKYYRCSWKLPAPVIRTAFFIRLRQNRNAISFILKAWVQKGQINFVYS